MSTEVYITKAVFHNFQSYDHRALYFTPGINALVGTSNSGKSAAMRGIMWCLDNDMSGTDFIRRGQDDCWVETSLSNGYAIKRRKTLSGNVNTYEVFRDGVPTTEAPLTGFGGKVPPEVIEARGMPSLDYIFAKQLEPSFLIHETPGKRAATIGNLEELGKIDQALQGTNEDVRVGAKEQKNLDAEIKAAAKKADELRKEIARGEPKVEALKTLKASITQKQQLVASIERSAQRLQEIDQDLQQQRGIVEKANRILAAWDDTLPAKVNSQQRILGWLDRLMAIDQELSSIHFMNAESLVALSQLVGEADRKTQQYQRLDASVRRLSEIDGERERIRKSYSMVAAALNFAPLDKQIESYRTMLKQIKRLEEIEVEVGRNNKSVEMARTQIDVLLNQFVEALQKAEVCPTCYQSTNEVSCNHVKQFIS